LWYTNTQYEICVRQSGNLGGVDWNDFDGSITSDRQHPIADYSASYDFSFVFDWVSQKMIFGLLKDLAKIKLSNEADKESASRRAIFYALKKQGGLYVKCLQVLAVTQKFLDGWAGPSEMKVFDQVDSEPVELDHYVNPAEFSWISDAPVANGSFAVVFKGILRSGEVVALKILRPSIERNLKKDLRTLKRLERMLRQFLPSTILDYSEVMSEFARTCLLETDYVREMANMEYFQKFYAGHPYVKIPKVHSRLCRKNIIVQEWIEGETFATVLAEQRSDKSASDLVAEGTGSNLWTQLVIVGGEAVRMALCADFVFGDPHPGNIKLLPNNQVAFIDFGIVASRPTSRMAFYRWVKAYHSALTGDASGAADLAEASITCFCPDVALALKDCKLGDESAMDKILDGVRKKMTMMVQNDSVASDLFKNGHFFRLFTDLLDSNNALDLRLDMANFQLLKAMQAFLGSVTVLDNGGTRDKFTGVMLAAMNYALDYAQQVGVENDLPLSSRYCRSENLEILLDTMSSLADGNEFLFNYLCGRI